MTASLTLSFFPVRSLFVIFSFLLTITSFRFVRFAHGANLRTLALSLRSNAVYVPVFRSKAMGQSIDCPIFQFISGKTGSLAFRRFSRVYSFRILAVSSHRLLFGSSGLRTAQTCAPSHCRFAPMPCTPRLSLQTAENSA